MEIGQTLYIATVIVYFMALLLFVRLQILGWWAKRTYWRKRPQLSVEKLKELYGEHGLPRLTILVPAYNESEVIGNTIEHLVRLKYASELLEILVVTDEKELHAKEGVSTQQVVEQKLAEMAGKAGLPLLRNKFRQTKSLLWRNTHGRLLIFLFIQLVQHTAGYPGFF